MTTLTYVVLAAVLLLAVLLGGLFGTVWFAGKSQRRTQARG